MEILTTILNIIIFLLCLSIVVCLHEAGHLAVAKICNVYCFEYSIGFGPQILKFKLKHKKKGEDGKVIFDAETNKPVMEEGETSIALRALPLGGYVAMAGEDGNETPEGVKIPPERCINGVNHAKQIAIMLAGILMNFITAILLFSISQMCPQTRSVTESNAVTISEDSVAYETGLRSGDHIIRLYQEYFNLIDNSNELVPHTEYPDISDRRSLTCWSQFIEGSAEATYNDLELFSIQYASCDAITMHNTYTTVTVDGVTTTKRLLESEYLEGLNVGPNSYRVIHVTYLNSEGDTVTAESERIDTVENTADDGSIYYTFNTFGISVTTEKTKAFYYGFGGAIKRGFIYFGNLFVGIYQAIGGLFTPSGWKSVGGIVSVYKMSAEGTTSGSASYFILLWGYISLNLGCFNLLPFPGLDGWQTLMALIESVIRKKLPSKFKNVANTVGLLILMALAVLLVIKDIIV